MCSVPCSCAIHDAGYKAKLITVHEASSTCAGLGNKNSDWEEHDHSTEGMIAHLGEYTVLEYLVEVVRKNGVKAVGKICTHKQ